MGGHSSAWCSRCESGGAHLTSVKLFLPSLLPWSLAKRVWALPDSAWWGEVAWLSHLSNCPGCVRSYTRGLSYPSKAPQSSPKKAAKASGSGPGNFCTLPGGWQPARAPLCHLTTLTPNSVSTTFPLRFMRPEAAPRPCSLSLEAAPSFLAELLRTSQGR